MTDKNNRLKFSSGMFKDHPELKKIFLAGFVFSFHIAATAYVNSSFVATFLGEGKVGLVFTLASILSIAALLYFPEVLRRIGSRKFFLFTVAGSALALLILSIFKVAWVAIPIFILYYAFNAVFIFILDELIEIFSRQGSVGRLRGYYLAFVSAAWVLAQIFSGKVLASFSFQVLYFIAFEMLLALFLVSYFFLRKLPDPQYDRAPIWNSVKTYFKNKKLARAYAFTFLLQFFFSWMVIYTPIYLNAHLGMAWDKIAIIFMIMLTPFVFMPIPLGKYSDKVGERKMLAYGFALTALATLALFFITTTALWVWALALFLTRVGASTVEIMADVYFFKHITPSQDEFIGVYRNTTPVAYIVGPLVATLLIAILPAFNYIYPILAAITSIGIYLAYTIETDDV